MKSIRISSLIIVIACAILSSSSAFSQAVPEPAGWYAGDPHVHRSCGNAPEDVSAMFTKMTAQNLACVSLLADSGNGEVQNPVTDLPLVNGKDDPISTTGQILHWDAEWHWDAIYTWYPHQALGGHVVTLGLSRAQQLWQEYTFPILDWAHQQNGIAGFAHLQYIDSAFPQTPTCCTPYEYPVEVALGTADFISEDVDDVNWPGGTPMYPENFISAYYRLLNSGFRPGISAGTDYPCNSSEPLGSLLTYVKTAGGQLSYRNWIEGISTGKVVISRNGHNEFVDLKVNSTFGPGDEIRLNGPGSVQVNVQWSAIQNLTGNLELVANGTVVASQKLSVSPGAPVTLSATVPFSASGWLAARRTDGTTHIVHTAAVYVTVNGAPVRANATDPQYFVQWMNNLLTNTNPGGRWNSFFPTSLTAAQNRYQAAKALFQQIAQEAQGTAPALTSIAVTPVNQTIAPGSTQQFIATGTYANGITLNLSGQVVWASSAPTIASINMRGLALGISSGSSVISATLGGVSGNTTLVVSLNPLTITSQNLPAGTVGVAYSSSVVATGGTVPYAWSIASGTLPSGLILNPSTGVIAGTPAAAGTFNFNVQATDASIPQQTAYKSFSIVILSQGGGGCPCSIWPSTAVPGTADWGPDPAVELGVKFRSDIAGYVTGIRFYKGTGNTGTHVGNLWNSSGALLASATFSGESATGWQQVNFTSPVAISANTTYIASYFAPIGHYAADHSYFATSGVDSTPLHALADGVDGGNGVYTYASPSSFPVTSYLASNYWVDVVFTTSIGQDTTPPTVNSVNPLSGATGVSTATAVSAVFSEAIDPTTINGNTFQLLGPGNALVAATVTYTGANNSATLAPSQALATSTSYAAVLTGGSNGVKDLAGNAMTANFTWSFTTSSTPPPPGSCPCSIWSSSTVPDWPDTGDTASVELGVRFRADVNGTITGIRFYKSAANGGTHVGNLWSNTGTLLATAVFSGETASGWQQVTLSNPVSILANTTYVASYLAPLGHYSDKMNYFTGSAADNAPLHALAAGVDGANGVYYYGSSSAFPTNTWQDANYWVDVVFVPSSTTTPPEVTAVVPGANSTGASLGQAVRATFSEPMTVSSINTGTFVLTDSVNNSVPVVIRYDNASATAILTPTVELLANATYKATLKGGSTGVQDFNGNPLANDYSWSFTTGAAPAPTGPGGPILIVTNLLNPFTRYYTEILSAEGLNEFTAADLATVTPGMLASYDVVILGDMSLSSSQATMFSNWVSTGGNLIAMHPDKRLAGLLGLVTTTSTLSNAYLAVQNSSGPGFGIVGDTIQFHGTADLYTLSGATNLASLYSNATNRTASPAVTLVGSGAGQAAAFTFDLARSIVYTRQGNPAWSGQKRDGQVPPIRSDDLFFGNASFDPQPDWIDFNKVPIPQADEQQRLLANLILQMESDKKPLPRFWYFPRAYKAVVIMTGDDHADFYGSGTGHTADRFDQYLAASVPGCSVADWECVRGTAYIFPPSVATSGLTNTQAASYVAQGFEIGMHLDTVPDCSTWTPISLDSFYTAELSSFAGAYPSLPAQRTHRTHCISNSDYDTQPQIELAHGIRLDTNWYYWPPTWVNDQPGFFTGSGMPMRFSDRNGNLIDTYQATTQMTDESGQTYPFTIDTLLDNAVGPLGYYGAFTANMHHDVAQSAGADAIVSSAQARGVPIVTSLQMLTWLDGRNSSSFGSLSWNGNSLIFTIRQGTGARNLQAMLPIQGPSGTLSGITFNGTALSFTTQTIKGVSYAMFNAATGTYQAIYNGASQSVLNSITLNPSSLVGGSPSVGTLVLSGPAPTGGAIVSLTNSNPAVATVPASVTIPGGSSSANFNVSTSAVTTTGTAVVTATYGAAVKATLTVNPPSVLSVALNPTSLLGGSSSTGTVTLSGVAPAGGVVVTLASSNTAVAQVPASVTVLQGTTARTFVVTTSNVTSTSTANINATFGTTATATLTVNPIYVTSVSLNPPSVVGGNTSTGTVVLNTAAPSSGVSVRLTSSNTAAATVPSSVTVLSGRTSATFTVTSRGVASTTTSLITATLGASATATLTVNAATLSSVSTSPTSVVGGNNATGTVALTGAAPPAGALVTLSSSNTAVARVPPSITISSGAQSGGFTITTLGVAAQTTVTLTAVYAGVSRTVILTVNPAALFTITRSPTSVVGGNNSTGTVTLTGAAPPSGALVTLSSSNTAVAQVPASLTVTAGSSSRTFTITTSGVLSQTSVTITASYAGVNRTTTLTVTPASLTSLTLSPNTVTGGTSSTATLTLNGAAPLAGALVTTSSSNTTAAQVPAQVTIPAGQTRVTFTVTTRPVTSRTTSTISGRYNGVTRSATLTVQ